MPRKAKDKSVENDVIDEKKVVKKKASSKKAAKDVGSVKKSTSAKKSTSEPAKKTTRKSSLAKIIESVGLDNTEEKVKKTKTTAKKATAKTTKTVAKKIEEAKPKTKTTKKTTSKKVEPKTAKKATVKKDEPKTAKNATSKKVEPKTAKKTSVKKDEPKTTKASTVTKADKKSKATTSSKTTSKKTKTSETTKKAPTKKRASKKSANTSKAVVINEYYDLPIKYGNTVVKLLAQTPKTLFVYWEVSDSDINNFKKQYGDDFFNKTKPYLIVHNLTLDKKYEIEINDFANSWYLNTDDSDCKFDIELVRKFIDNSSDNNEDEADYLYIAKSNNIISPNNHILFEKIQEFVIFRNSSNNNIIKKNVKSFKFLKDIYKFYKDMYDEEILDNPSSQFNFQ